MGKGLFRTMVGKGLFRTTMGKGYSRPQWVRDVRDHVEFNYQRLISFFCPTLFTMMG